MISANSAMRTKPASTIGEIGAGAGEDATASASGESGGEAASMRMPPCSRSSTTAAPDAPITGRVLISLITDANC